MIKKVAIAIVAAVVLGFMSPGASVATEEALPSFDVTFTDGGRFWGEIDWLDADSFKIYGHVRDICPGDMRAAIGQFFLDLQGSPSTGFTARWVQDNGCGYMNDLDFTYTVNRSQTINSATAQISLSETGNHNQIWATSTDRDTLWNPYR